MLAPADNAPSVERQLYNEEEECVIFFPINAPGMGRFQLFNLGVLGYGLRFWVVIAIIVSLTLTITSITTLTII